MSTAAGPRSVRVDALRGFAMLFVVAAHAVQRNIGVDVPLAHVASALEMPLFALVSGYLTNLPPGARARKVVGSRATRLLVPFIAWAPLHWVMSHFAFSGLDVLNMPESLFSYVTILFARPIIGLWYLLVLFEWWMVLLLARACFTRFDALTVGVTGAAVVLAAHVLRFFGLGTALGDFGLMYFEDMLPFFIGGWALRQRGRLLDTPLPRGGAVAGVLLVAAMVALVLAPTPGFPGGLLPGPAGGWPLWAYRTARSALGVAGCVLLLRSRAFDRFLPPMEVLGRYSMGIYAIHLMFLRTGFGSGWAMVVSSFAVALGVSLAATWALRRTPVTASIFLGEVPARSRVEGMAAPPFG